MTTKWTENDRKVAPNMTINRLETDEKMSKTDEKLTQNTPKRAEMELKIVYFFIFLTVTLFSSSAILNRDLTD